MLKETYKVNVNLYFAQTTCNWNEDFVIYASRNALTTSNLMKISK